MNEDFEPFAVILLIRWLQNHVQTPDGRTHSLDRIAEEILGLTRHTLNRFLSENLNRDEQKRRARDYAEKLKPVFDQGRPFPDVVRDLYEKVYGEDSFEDTVGDKPVKLPEILRHRVMTHVPRNHADIGPLIGLSVLIRLSGDSVPAPELSEGASLPGWSLSVLSVLPTHVQRGLNHPLFILRQRALDSNATVTIHGVVIPQADRFMFQGIDILSRHPFHAYFRVPDEWLSYRDASQGEPVFGSGLMMGLSSTGQSPFCGLFELFAIPGTTLAPGASVDDRAAFEDRYKETIRNGIGVRNLDDTVSELEALGVRGRRDHLLSTLRTLRDRTRAGTLLKP